MQQESQGFIGAAAADEMTARMRASAPDGQVVGEVAMQSFELPPQVTESGGEAAAVRLEKRTHLDEGKYRITLRNYGEGLGREISSPLLNRLHSGMCSSYIAR